MKWSLLLFGLVAIAGTAAACDGLSPGDQLETDAGLCTLGFLVADPNGLYFTTAGHCIDVDQVARSPDVGEFGRGVFHYLEPDNDSPQDGSPGDDFGLIRIHEGAYASLNPKMCGWAGPTGIYTDTPGGGMLRLYGHGLVFGEFQQTRAREATLIENDGDAFYFVGPGVPGDSGSAVLHEDGRAMGVLTHLQIGGTSTNGGTHLDRGFRLAADAGFTQLRLVLMGQDPLAVLNEMRAPPQHAEELPPTQGSAAPPANGTARPPEPPTQPPPASNATQPGDADDSIVPAAEQGADPGGQNATPFASATFVVLAFALALALARRRR